MIQFNIIQANKEDVQDQLSVLLELEVCFRRRLPQFHCSGTVRVPESGNHGFLEPGQARGFRRTASGGQLPPAFLRAVSTRFPSRGFWCAASRTQARGFRRAASGARLPARRFRRAAYDSGRVPGRAASGGARLPNSSAASMTSPF